MQSVNPNRQELAAESAFAVMQFKNFGGQVQQLKAKQKRKPRPYKLKQKYIPESYKPR